MERVVSPLRYPGGKSLILPFVESFLQENDLIGSIYAEPFAGGAGLALSLLYNGLVSKIYINDYDKAIYTFWKVALTETERFCRWIKNVSIDVTTWKKFHKIHSEASNVSDFDLAKATFFLNRTNVSGVIKGGVIGGLDQTGSYKIDARFNKSALIKRIELLKEHEKKIIVSNQDAISFLKQRERMCSPIFIYLDPPYYKKASNLYMNFYRDDDHKELADFVLKMKKKWMVSYDNQDFIHNLYNSQRRVVYSLQQSTSNRIGKEILVFKDELIFNDSIKKLKNAECCK